MKEAICRKIGIGFKHDVELKRKFKIREDEETEEELEYELSSSTCRTVMFVTR